MHRSEEACLLMTSLALWFAACGGNAGTAHMVASEEAPPDTTSGESRRGVTLPMRDEATGLALSLRVQSFIRGELRPVAPGASLRSGARIELVVEVDRPAFVYVAQFFADGTSQILFPAGDSAERLPAARAVRIPGDGRWFELDDNLGDEHVYVAASALPLEHAEAAIAEAIHSVRTSSSAAGGRGTPSRSSARPRAGRSQRSGRQALLDIDTRSPPITRGLITVSATHALDARADDDGVIVLHFPIRHLRRR